MKNGWKKPLALALRAVMVVSLLTSCGKKEQPTGSGSSGSGAGSSTNQSGAEDVGDPVKLIFSIAAVPTDAHGAAQKVFKETLEQVSDGNMTVL